MASSEGKISVYNLADLKNTSDDAIPNYLNSLKFKQSHRLTDVRLGLGYSAFAIAAACFLWDYKLGFDSTKWWTAAAVSIYSLLNGILTVWILYVEKGTIYEGTSPSGETLRISTSTTKNVPVYNLKVQVTSKDGKTKMLEISRPFNEWFDASGQFVVPPFQTMLATSVPVVGQLDPKRIAAAAATASTSAAPEQSSSIYSPEILEALANESVETATGADVGSAKKNSKRRKA